MDTIYSIDFKKISREDAFIPIMDRGFLYGDSIYEAVRTYQGRLFLLDRHFSRLMNSASRLMIKVPFDLKKLECHLKELVSTVDFDCYIRIMVTRGEDQVFDLYPGRELKSKTIIVIRKSHEYPASFYSDGISLEIVTVRRNPKTSLDPEIKSGNYLNNVLAIMEAKAKGANDALMMNERGHVTECTTSNFFLVKDGTVCTPKLDAGILAGITREFLAETMDRKGIAHKEADLTEEDVYQADECFITATTKELMPVTKCSGRTIGNGKVGPVTRKLMEIFRKEALRVTGLA